MTFSLLHSGELKDFQILGQDGKAVYKVAPQIRKTFSVKLGKKYADFLAIPQCNDKGEMIDWYIPFAPQNNDQYNIVPWTAASPEEQASALEQLQDFEQTILIFGKKLASQPDLQGDQLLFSRLIYDPNYKGEDAASLLAIRYPSEDYVYIVDGKPVITFWGFVLPETDLSGSPLYNLKPASMLKQSIPTALLSSTPVMKKPWYKKWWFWSLLLLLLLLFGCYFLYWFFFLPKLTLNNQIVPNNNEIHLVNDPDKSNIISPQKNKTLNVSSTSLHQGKTDDSINNLSDGINLPTDEMLNNELTTDLPQEDHLTPAEDINKNTTDPDNKPVDNDATNSDNLPPNIPDLGDAEPPADQDTPDIGANPNSREDKKLKLSDQDLQAGTTKFLDGVWQVGGGVQDSATGKPLQLKYDFNNGQGNVTLTRSDGVSCTGKVSSNINSQNLNINTDNEASCSDNTKYKLPKIECKPGKDNQAECQGAYSQGDLFPITIKKQ